MRVISIFFTLPSPRREGVVGTGTRQGDKEQHRETLMSSLPFYTPQKKDLFHLTHLHTHTLTYPHTLTHPHTLTYPHTLTHPHTHTHTLTYQDTDTHTLLLSLSLSHTHTHTHSLTHSYTLPIGQAVFT